MRVLKALLLPLLLIITLIGLDRLDRLHGPQPPSAQPERAGP